MSYDYHFYTKYTPYTGINSPLYSNNDDIGYFSTLNINYSTHYWNFKGMDKEKIVVGLPTYGHSYQYYLIKTILKHFSLILERILD